MHFLRLLLCLHFLVTACLCATPQQSFAQESAPSMAMSTGRAGVSSVTADGRFLMPSADLFRVEEFANYHRHEIPLPIGDRRVNLSVQQARLSSGKTVVRFGLATPRDLGEDEIPPLNLVLVIDQSSSMSGDRINCVKAALHSLVQRLRKHDKVTIVGFSSKAVVHLQATDKTKTKKVNQAIENIYANGNTNLHAGLMLGYKQAEQNFDPERTNRVILLTDGITNTGVTDLPTIARDSKKYNKKGIDLSTIGLGNNLNHELLRKLADSGRGLIHFVADEVDIEKTFVKEVESLLAPAARKVKLTIDFGSAADGAKIFGYSPKRVGNTFVFQLKDLNHGATQVVMARLPKNYEGPVAATLQYKDAISSNIETQQITLGPDEMELENSTVIRDYAIAIVGNALNRAATSSNEGNCDLAARQLKKGIASARKLIPNRNDENVERIVDIASDYERRIRSSITAGKD